VLVSLAHALFLSLTCSTATFARLSPADGGGAAWASMVELRGTASELLGLLGPSFQIQAARGDAAFLGQVARVRVRRGLSRPGR
jgi:hypothetical protein